MSRFYNRTRQTPSIPRRLMREGKLHLLPVYYVGLTSALGKEAIENSASYRFADHVYANKPAGRFGIGFLLDALFLNLPSARALRSRYRYARAEIMRTYVLSEGSGSVEVLAVPCGLARELFDAAATLNANPMARPVRLWGMDLDPSLIDGLNHQAATATAKPDLSLQFVCGDALRGDAYPPKPFDLIVSLGFTEFLDDDLALDFYRVVAAKLKPTGRFVTSGMRPHRFSDYLLRNVADLQTHYRSSERLRSLARQAGLEEVRTYDDATGLQTMLIASRRP